MASIINAPFLYLANLGPMAWPSQFFPAARPLLLAENQSGGPFKSDPKGLPAVWAKLVATGTSSKPTHERSLKMVPLKIGKRTPS